MANDPDKRSYQKKWIVVPPGSNLIIWELVETGIGTHAVVKLILLTIFNEWVNSKLDFLFLKTNSLLSLLFSFYYYGSF